ncbi:MAG: DUF484 family protein [Kiloniellaceae bacterium]
MTQNRQDAAPRRGEGKRPTGTAPTATHPDFLCEHPGLLDVLSPPARVSADGVTDLQQFMVAKLRHDLADMTAARDELVATGRGNLQTQARVHKAVLALLSARTFEHFVEAMTIDLAVILGLDVITIGVEQAGPEAARPPVPGVCGLAPGTVDRKIGPGQRIALRAEAPEDPMIFGPGAGLVRSDALIRLSIGCSAPAALLAFGSRRPGHFQPGQATELLTFLSQIVEHAIRGWLSLAD